MIVLDLWSKTRVFEWIESNPPGGTYSPMGVHRYPVMGDFLAFTRSWNHGVAWGMLDDYPHVIVWGRCIAVLFLLWLVVRTPSSRRLMVVSLVLILSGAVGNLYDNLTRIDAASGEPFGAVRDFIDVYFGSLGWDYHFPTFNVADSCISVGAVLLFLSSFFGGDPEADPGARTGSAA